MDNTRIEETDSLYKIVKHLPWSKKTVAGRISYYTKDREYDNQIIEENIRR